MTPQQPTGSFGQEPIDRVQDGASPEKVAIELLERVYVDTLGASQPKKKPSKERK